MKTTFIRKFNSRSSIFSDRYKPSYAVIYIYIKKKTNFTGNDIQLDEALVLYNWL